MSKPDRTNAQRQARWRAKRNALAKEAEQLRQELAKLKRKKQRQRPTQASTGKSPQP